MSQTGQAQNLHREGVQRLEEARRDFEAATGRVHEADRKLKGELTEAERKTWTEKFEAAYADAKALKTRAAALADLSEGQQTFDRLSGEPVYRRPMGADTGEDLAAEPGDTRQPRQTERVGLRDADPAARLAAGDWGPNDPENRIVLRGRARTLLNKLLRPASKGGGWQGLKEDEAKFLTAPRPEVLMSPYVDRDGGFITAEELRNEVIGYVRDITYIRQRARVIATTASSVAFPTAVIKLPLSKTRAGRGTGETPTILRDVFGKTRFTPAGSGKIVKVPEELIDDMTFDVVSFLAEEIAREDIESEDNLFINGTGSGEPLGILPALTKLSAAGYTGLKFAHSGAAGADFTPDDIKITPYKLRKAMRAGGAEGGGAWTCHRVFLEKVSIMRTEEGGAGTGQYLFRQGTELGDPDRLVGYPVLESEFFPDNITSPSAGDPIVLFGNWRHYWIVDRKSLDLRVLAELYSETDEVGYKFAKRFDAAPVRAEAFVYMEAK